MKKYSDYKSGTKFIEIEPIIEDYNILILEKTVMEQLYKLQLAKEVTTKEKGIGIFNRDKMIVEKKLLELEHASIYKKTGSIEQEIELLETIKNIKRYKDLGSFILGTEIKESYNDSLEFENKRKYLQELKESI